MKSTFTFLVFTILFTISVTASKVYQGYVILNSNEKIEGAITMLSPSLNEVKVKFAAKSGEDKIFKAKEVKEYGFKVSKWNKTTRQHEVKTIVYVRKEVERSPIAFGSTQVLIERQITGAVNMYNHFIEQNANKEAPFIHVVYVEKEADNLEEITKDNYRMVLKEMMSDYSELATKIGTKGYGFKHIPQIITTYNNWKTDNGGTTLGMR